MNKISALIGFVTLIVTVVSYFVPGRFDNDLFKLIIIIINELKFELFFISSFMILLSFNKSHCISTCNKYIKDNKIIVSVFIVMLILSLINDIKLMCRARFYFYRKNLLYAKYSQSTANEYIILIKDGYFNDAEEFYKKRIDGKFNEIAMKYIFQYKKMCDSAIEESNSAFKTYTKMLENNDDKLTIISIAYLYKAYAIYPKNSIFYNEIDKVYHKFYDLFKTIPIIFNKCKENNYSDVYSIYNENSWFYFDKSTAGYLLPENLSSQREILSKTDKLCKYLLENGQKEFTINVINSWQIKNLHVLFNPKNIIEYK